MLPIASPTKPAAVWPAPGLAALSPSAPPRGAATLSDMYGNRYCAAQKRAAVCSIKPAEPSTPKLLPTDAGRVAFRLRPHIDGLVPTYLAFPLRISTLHSGVVETPQVSSAVVAGKPRQMTAGRHQARPGNVQRGALPR